MTTMLGEVVRNGTGACAAIPGYTVAGKTGTSRKAAPEGGYTDQTNASFVGFAPAENPRLAGIVVLDEPTNEFGSVAAAPVFSEIVQSALNQYRVAPTDVGDQRQFDAARAHAAEEGSNCTVLHGAALQEHLARAGRSRRGRRQDRRGRPGRVVDRSGIGPDRYPRRRHVPERLGGRVRMHDLLDGLDVLSIHGDPDVDVRSVVHDSRNVRPGALFACIRGSVTDGHAHAAAAVDAGAIALLVEHDVDVPVPQACVESVRRTLGPLAARFHGDPSHAMRVLGVTGTNGKTTVTYVLEAIAQAHGDRVGRIGTLGTVIDGVGEPPVHTTPEATELQASFAAHARRGCRNRRDGGVLTRARPAARRRHAVRRGVLHEPLAGSPRLPPHDGRLLRGEGALVHATVFGACRDRDR